MAWGKERGVELQPLYQDSDSFATTAPVGTFPRGSSRFGPNDVAGNVWEWVGDWFGDYTPVDQDNPKGPDEGARKVIRGGAFNGSYATWLRPSFRFSFPPEASSHGIGFRCASKVRGESDPG